ncbi:MAG: hypothetical protein VW199_01815 [Methylophilaceae bacterium]
MNPKETSIVKVAIDVPIDDFFDYQCEENVSLEKVSESENHESETNSEDSEASNS